MEETAVESEIVAAAGLSIQQVFPNPTQDKIQVQFSHGQEEMIQVELYDLMGKMIFAQQWFAYAGNNGLSVDLSDIAAGHYVLALRSNQAVDTQLIQKD
ncbi:MAG: T9SS type A sorting domain-containing protein [Bacteroidetes bacterium]|nr:T9SS type A sorting domain-containing protein [Bacteroidota bacterium]